MMYDGRVSGLNSLLREALAVSDNDSFRGASGSRASGSGSGSRVGASPLASSFAPSQLHGNVGQENVAYGANDKNLLSRSKSSYHRHDSSTKANGTNSNSTRGIGFGVDMGVGLQKTPRSNGKMNSGHLTSSSRYDQENGSNSTIYRCCDAIMTFLEEHYLQTDQLRAFMETSLPMILKSVFGFHQEGMNNGWLHAVAKSGMEKEAKILMTLLAPDGLLLRAANKVDNELHLKFVFPGERLPKRTQVLLRSSEGYQALDMLPHYCGKLTMMSSQSGYELHTSVQGYYFWWFTYYVIKSGNTVQINANQGWRSSPGVHFGGSVQNNGSATPWSGALGSPFQMNHFGSRSTPADVLHIKTSTGRRHPYLELLVMYMSYYLPMPEKISPMLNNTFVSSILSANAVIAGESLNINMNNSVLSDRRGQNGVSTFQSGDRAHSTTTQLFESSSLISSGSKGMDAFLLSTLVDAWLSDFAFMDSLNESPAKRSSRLTSGHTNHAHKHFNRGYSLASYQPPSEDLLAALRLLIKYLMDPRDELGAGCGYHQSGTTTFLASNGTVTASPQKSVGSFAKRSYIDLKDSISVIRKPVYMMLLSAFEQWPQESTSRMSPLVDVLMALIAPWVVRGSKPPIQHRDSIAGQLSAVVGRAAGSSAHTEMRKDLDSRWKSHISDNVVLYSILLQKFLNLQLRRTAIFPDSVARQLSRVLGQLGGYPQVSQLVSEAEALYNSYLLDGDSLTRSGQPPVLQRLLSQISELEGISAGEAPMSLSLFTEEMNGGGDIASAILQSLQSACHNGKLDKRRLDDAQEACNTFFGHRPHSSSGNLRTISFSQLKNFSGRTAKSTQRNFDGTPSPLTKKYEDDSPARQRMVAGSNESTPGVLPKNSWRDIQYKGDWMHRPTGRDEIRFLSKIFVSTSDKLNKLSILRQNGLKVNLRPLGEKQSVILFFCVIFVSIIVHYFVALIWSIVDSDIARSQSLAESYGRRYPNF